MLTLLSPAKTLDLSPTPAGFPSTQPQHLTDTDKLVQILRKLKATDIQALMHVSEKIATLNYERYQQFSLPFTSKNAKPALLCFKGDVYTDIDVEHYSSQDFAFAQQHIAMLSGLYGLLRPLDLMQPYRLEMGTKLKTAKGKDLYQFWDSRITESVNRTLADSGSKVLINLASQEYFSAVKPALIQGTLVTPVFKEYKGGSYKIIALFAKRARGAMADYIIKERLNTPEGLKDFTRHGYRFIPELSSDTEWVFGR